MRALLVANPKATATTARGRDVLFRALGSELKVDVAETQRRGHAIELGRQATADGIDIVVALGGDGTVNAVINGMLAAGPGQQVPMLAVVPGGSTNVFSRALGVSRNPVEATSELLDALRGGRSRLLSLGRADERWFTFTAGLGLDAQAIRTVERKRLAGRRATPTMFVNAALSEYLLRSDRRRPTITLTRPGRPDVPHLYLGIVTNTVPWTYFFDRPVHVTPKATFETGLDLFAMRRLGLLPTTRAALGMLHAAGHGPRGRAVLQEHDLHDFTLSATRPLAFQVDGDYLGERECVHFTAHRDALRVVV
jgi:diacylglycerol kinase family enzyme